VTAIGRDDLATDSPFTSFAARNAHRAELLAMLDQRFAEAPTADWLARLRGVIPIAPVRTMEDALDRGEQERRHMLAEYQHPTLGTVASVGLPITVGDYQPPYRRGPRLGENTAAVMTELGYSTDATSALTRRGAFGAMSEARDHIAAAE
jgi:crotonobetainyl-CoA:carnitine CoA-transferase CaiB-like acyl-CoA transferase